MRALVFAVVLVAAARPADAGKIALGTVHAEPDVADEGAAVALLAHSALIELAGDCPTLPATTIASTARALAAIKADHGVLVDIAREGVGLRATVVIVPRQGGAPIVSSARAGDGHVTALADHVVEAVAKVLAVKAVPIPSVSLGQLRPFAAGLRSRDAVALAQADPALVAKLPAIAVARKGVAATVVDRPAAVMAARALGDLATLDRLATGRDPAAAAARVFAAIARGDLAKAKRLAGATAVKEPLMALATVVLAAANSDDAALAAAITAALDLKPRAPVVAAAARIEARRLRDTTLDALVANAPAREIDTGTAALVGLVALERGRDRDRALALVSARELATTEITRLGDLIRGGTDPEAIRLRAEVAMRSDDDAVADALAAWAKLAGDDARALRAAGWLAMARDGYADAAKLFARARSPREQMRALAAAGELERAREVISEDSAEDLVVLARLALAAQRYAEASGTLDRAERLAPASPLVHAAILELLAEIPDEERAAISRTLAAKKPQPSIVTVKPPVADVAVGPSGSAQPKVVAIDPQAQLKQTELPEVREELAPLADLLGQLPAVTGKIVLAGVRTHPPWWVLRRADRDVVGAGLTALLRNQRIEVEVVADVDGQDEVAAYLGNAEATLAYEVEPDGGKGTVTLTLSIRRGPPTRATGKIGLPGLIEWNLTKLFMLGGFLLLFLIGLGIYITRSTGVVIVLLEKVPDMLDDAICVAISKSPLRPIVDDNEHFHEAIKKAGARVSPSGATLISSGTKLRVGSGRWYVHCYGTYLRNNLWRRVPETCTEIVEVERNQHHEVKFNLISQLADVTLVVVTPPGQSNQRLPAWADRSSHLKVYTDGSGEARFELAPGEHVLHIEIGGQIYDHPISIVSPKLHRVVFNLERELRLREGIELDAAVVSDLEVELGHGRAWRFPTAPVVAPEQSAELRVDEIDGSQSQRWTRIHTRYRIGGELARWASGIAHYAFDEQLERDVAILRLAEGTAPLGRQIALQHRNLLTTYDRFSEGTGAFLVLELVDGHPLDHILASHGALSWREAIVIIDQVLSAVMHIHAASLVHGDVHPSNIVVTRDWSTKLVAISRSDPGTAHYPAPEVHRGRFDHRVDLYAVGATMFELVAGRPWAGPGDLLVAPRIVEAWVTAMMAPDPDDRPAAADVRAALREIYAASDEALA